MLLLDGQVHHDTHVIPMGNYVIGVGNYVSVSPSGLGNYVSADTQALVQSITGQSQRAWVCPVPNKSALCQLMRPVCCFCQ